jgi:hypothetical protein
MKGPESEQQIQPSVSFTANAAPAPVGNVIQGDKAGPVTLAAGTAFGALAGLAMGAIVGAACCWLIGLFDLVWRGILIGILAGPLAGAAIGYKERTHRGDLVQPDTGTFVCVLFGLLPALQVVFQGLGGVTGKFSGLVLIGAGFAGPMLGLLIGGTFDRAFDAYLRKSRGGAMLFSVTGVALCLAIVAGIDALAYGPDPEKVSWKARAMLAEEWAKDPALQQTKIRQVTLVRKGRKTYTGTADVTLAGQPNRLALEVRVEDEMIEVRWTAAAQKEPGD